MQSKRLIFPFECIHLLETFKTLHTHTLNLPTLILPQTSCNQFLQYYPRGLAAVNV